MMQGFGWDSCDKGGWYNILSGQVDEIKELGVTQLWLPPPSNSVSKQGYLPGQLYDLDTPYGSKSELVSLLSQLRDAGIASLADIVINHRCADEQDEKGRWNKFADKVEHPGRSIAWGRWAIVGDEEDGFGGQGSRDSGAGFDPAPDLDHANEEVRESLKDWLRWLHSEIGYSGWRLDYVKGFAAKYAKEYVAETVGADAPVVGEFWADLNWRDSTLDRNQDGARQALINYLDSADGMFSMFDFPTKGILQEAVRNTEYWRMRDDSGKAPGLLGWWPSRSVTFLDNHDTGSTQQHWPFPKDKVMTGYAYILTHPGVPCLLHDHVFSWKLAKEIKPLIELRQRVGIHRRSKLEILCAEDDMYVARIDNKLTLKLGPRYDMGSHVPSKDDGWAMVANGCDFAIWERKDS